MSRLTILALLLALAACAEQPAPIAPHSVSAECRLDFSPRCLRPYVAAAKLNETEIVNNPGSDGASIPTLTMTYGPLSPTGFRGASRVTVK